MHSTPSTTPMPVTTLAPTVKSEPQPASGDSSRNAEPSSTSSSIRSRASSLPRAWCRSTYFSPAAGDRLGVLGVEVGELLEHRRSAVRAPVEVAHDGVPQQPRGQVGQHLGRSSSDRQDPGVAVVPLDLGPVHVAGAAVSWTAWSQTYVARLDGGLLGQAGLGDDVLAGDVPRGDRVGVGPRHLDLPVHLDELVPDHLVGDQRLAEGLAVAAVRRGQRERAGGDAVAVHGQADPLDDELLGDLDEAGVLLARRRFGRPAPRVDVGELGGVGAVPAHLGQRRGRP